MIVRCVCTWKTENTTMRNAQHSPLYEARMYYYRNPWVLTQFFTVWSLILAMLPVHPPWRRATALMVSVVGAYLTYIHPRVLCVPGSGGICLRGSALCITDLVFHQAPLVLLFAWWWWTDHQSAFLDAPGVTLALVLVGVFVAFHDIQDIYGLLHRDILVIFFAMILAGFSWLNLKGNTRVR